MSYGMIENPTLVTSIFSDANTLCSTTTKTIWVNSIRKRMKVSLLAIQPLVKSNRVFNKRTLVVEESIHIVFYEYNNLMIRNDKDIIDLDKEVKKLAINEDNDETLVQEQGFQESQEDA